jgi:SPP1 family predicted phage head-tail adaptor
MANPCKNGFNFASLAKHRVTIQKQIKTEDGYGGTAVAWQDLAIVWAIIKPYSGREVFYSEQKQSRVTHKITVRYNALFADTKVTGSYRILYGDRVLNVRFIRNLELDMENEGRDYQEMTAEENAQTIEG